MTSLASFAEQAFLDDLDKKLWNATDCRALISKKKFSTQYMVGALREAQAEVQHVAVRATPQIINRGVLVKQEIVPAPPALAQAYSDKVPPLFEMRIMLTEQSCTLTILRDTLIPKLLSGDLSVATKEAYA